MQMKHPPAPHKEWLEMLKEADEENARLRDILGQMHTSYMQMSVFNISLRDQIRRHLFYDPPPGITYGIHRRTIGTQTLFVPPKENERTDRSIKALLERDGC